MGTGAGDRAGAGGALCGGLDAGERHWELLKGAGQRFADLGIVNITPRHGDGSRGWPEQAPFDRILVTAAAADVPPVLIGQLAVGGLMVVPVGEGFHDQRLELVRRTGNGVETRDLGAVRFVPLVAGTGPDSSDRSHSGR